VTVIVGIFVGGASTRMGRTKALLPSPEGVTLVERQLALARTLGADVVLVGRRADVPPIAPVLDDARAHAGPLGGLVALLAHAGARPAIALACDMPFVTADLMARLAAAPPAIALAPRRDGRWEPLCARYDAPGALPVARERLERGALSMQGLLDAVGATELPLAEGEAALLDDWDTPADVSGSS
jgi:molybdopterin-guanine dinucleotide biosynthesis protein A